MGDLPPGDEGRGNEHKNAMESRYITGRKVGNMLRSVGMGGDGGMLSNTNNDNIDVDTGLQDEAQEDECR
jgi:hypothetical protein